MGKLSILQDMFTLRKWMEASEIWLFAKKQAVFSAWLAFLT
jgi:hypothetical protein